MSYHGNRQAEQEGILVETTYYVWIGSEANKALEELQKAGTHRFFGVVNILPNRSPEFIELQVDFASTRTLGEVAEFLGMNWTMEDNQAIRVRLTPKKKFPESTGKIVEFCAPGVAA